MATVTPPPPPPPPVVQTAAQPTAVVSNPPSGLTSVAAGTRIDAIIVATTPDGRVEVETRLGRFLMQPNVTLPKYGPIQLQVQTLARHLFLAITSIHGKAPQAALRGLGLSGAPASAVGQTSTTSIGATTGANTPAAGVANTSDPAGPTPLAAGTTVTATVLKPARPGTPAANAAAASRTNSSAGSASARPAGTPTQASPGAVSSSRNAGSAPVSGAQAAAAYGGQSAARVSPSGPVLIPSGNAFMVKITTVTPPSAGGPSALAQPATAATLIPGQTLNGVISTSPSPNTTVVQTHAGPVSLNTPAQLPAGTGVQFDVLEQLPLRVDGSLEQAAAKRISTFLLQNRAWPAFEEAVGVLRESNPQAAMQLISSALPRPDSALAANIMQFLLGARSGELAGWIGDSAARILQRDRPDLMNRMRDEFRIMGRMSEEPVSSDWRALPVPVANGGEIQQIQLLMRRVNSEEEDEEDHEQGPGTRFIVDVDLSRMGRIQLDGFVQDASKRFDLVIRSESRMADQVQNEVRAIFEDAQELTGTTGGLRFQAAPPKFVDVVGDEPNGEIGLVV